MGLFITFEGVEGCGKSTQIALLGEYIGKSGLDVLTIREPGGTPTGEAVRRILLDSNSEIGPMAELLLYEACRAELVLKVIRPALKAGKVVISDRFMDSTVAYQGYGRGLDIEAIKRLNRLVVGETVPDLTILLDCDPEAGLRRAISRIEKGKGPREDRFEREEIAFHKRVRDGFLSIAKEEKRVSVVDASPPREIASIHGEICDIMEKMGY
ncbi:MAG: dTMP kinase [Deltaproteobacteria bacterium]|nr:dTMP kinase [Deltaproteobacteria bacterium]